MLSPAVVLALAWRRTKRGTLFKLFKLETHSPCGSRLSSTEHVRKVPLQGSSKETGDSLALEFLRYSPAGWIASFLTHICCVMSFGLLLPRQRRRKYMMFTNERLNERSSSMTYVLWELRFLHGATIFLC